MFDLAIDAYYSETGFGGSYTPPEGGAALTDVCFAVLGNMVDQLEFSRDNPNLTRAIMMNTGRSPYYDRAEAVGGVEYLTGFIADAYGESRQALVSRETCARYIFNGAMGLCRDWVRAGMVEPPTAVAKRCLLLNLQCASLIAGEALDPAVERAIEEWEPRAGGPRAKEPRAGGRAPRSPAPSTSRCGTGTGTGILRRLRRLLALPRCPGILQRKGPVIRVCSRCCILRNEQGAPSPGLP